MMIKKFNIINIGSFLDFNRDDSFSSINKEKEEKVIELLNNGLNIFYGDNGNGKSTIVRIFKKINGENKSILEKHRDFEDKEQNFNFENNKGEEYNLQNKLENKFIIFDKEYIKNNIGDIVFGDESTESNKNRGNNLILLGDFVKKEKIVNKYENIIKELGDKNLKMYEGLIKQENKLNEKLLNNKKIDNYKEELKKIKEEKDLNENIKNLKIKIEQLEINMKNREKLKDLKKLETLDIINFNKNSSEAVFKETFNSINFNYGESEEIETLLDITKNNDLNKCILCENKIKDNDGNYIKRMENLFNYFLSDKEKEISNNLTSLEKIILFIEDVFELFNTANELKFTQFKNCSGDKKLEYKNFSIILNYNEKELLINLKEQIKNKNNIKSEIITIDLGAFDALVNKFNNEIKNFNENIKNINTEISNLKTIDISKIQKELSFKKDDINRYKNIFFIQNNISSIEQYFKEYEKYEKNKLNIKNVEQLKDYFKLQMNSDFKQFAEKYGKEIKDTLKKFNSSISINLDIGVTSNTSYNRGASRCGFEYKYKTKNIVKSLSEGEKRSIALSFFFAGINIKIKEKDSLENEIINLNKQIKQENDKERKIDIGIKIKEKTQELENVNSYFNKVLILDDPAVDFDSGHKKQIAGSVAKFSNYFSQSFVFSHDNLFVKYLGNSIGTGGGSKKDFWIYKTKGISNITIFDLDIFRKYLEALNKFIEIEKPNIEDLYINTYKLRFCLEKFIKDELFGFNHNKIDGLINGNLKDISKIKEVNEKYINELKDIYDFCNSNGSHYSESEGFNALMKNIKSFLEIYKKLNDLQNNK